MEFIILISDSSLDLDPYTLVHSQSDEQTFWRQQYGLILVWKSFWVDRQWSNRGKWKRPSLIFHTPWLTWHHIMSGLEYMYRQVIWKFVMIKHCSSHLVYQYFVLSLSSKCKTIRRWIEWGLKLGYRTTLWWIGILYFHNHILQHVLFIHKHHLYISI